MKLIEYFKYNSIANEAYKNILETLKGSRGVCTKILKTDLKDKHRKLEIEKLWKHVI